MPAALTKIVAQIHLEEFSINANLEDMQTRGKLPSAKLKLRADDITGSYNFSVDVPEMDYTKADKFVKVVGDQIIKVATDLNFRPRGQLPLHPARCLAIPTRPRL